MCIEKVRWQILGLEVSSGHVCVCRKTDHPRVFAPTAPCVHTAVQAVNPPKETDYGWATGNE